MLSFPDKGRSNNQSTSVTLRHTHTQLLLGIGAVLTILLCICVSLCVSPFITSGNNNLLLRIISLQYYVSIRYVISCILRNVRETSGSSSSTLSVITDFVK